MCHYLNPTEPASTERHRIHPRCCERPTTSNTEEYDRNKVMSSVERSWGNSKQVLYHVKWLDYPECKDWMEEPFDNLPVGSLEKLREFHQPNPDAPSDHWLTQG